MARNEKKVKQNIRQILDSFNAYHFMPATHGYGASGTHDTIACYRGIFISIEAKATDKQQPTALQTRAARQVVEAGGIALLIHEGNTQLVASTLHVIAAGGLPPSYWPGLFDEG